MLVAVLLALPALLAAAGCQKTLPTSPTTLDKGIVIYEDANFAGASAYVTEDISDLREVRGPCPTTDWFDTSGQPTYSWNDCISSVRVAPGWRATLYRDDGYRDDSWEILEDISDLRTIRHDCPHGGLNDCVTSIRVRPR